MSTISTQPNCGSSYIVNDFYGRFINQKASEKQKVVVGRISTVLLMIAAAVFSFYLKSAKDVFDLLLQIVAGTGLLFILRWFWKRINPYSEIAAMAISFVIAIFFFINDKLETKIFNLLGYEQLILGVVITTIGWIIVTLITKPSKEETIEKFENLIFDKEAKFENIGLKITAFLIGTIAIYSFLFATGNWIYGKATLAISLSLLSITSFYSIYKIMKKINN